MLLLMGRLCNYCCCTVLFPRSWALRNWLGHAFPHWSHPCMAENL